MTRVSDACCEAGHRNPCGVGTSRHRLRRTSFGDEPSIESNSPALETSALPGLVGETQEIFVSNGTRIRVGVEDAAANLEVTILDPADRPDGPEVEQRALDDFIERDRQP